MRAVDVRGEFVGVVGRAREQDRSALRALGHEDYGVQFHAVAHGNHYFAPAVVEAAGSGLNFGGHFTRQAGVL